MTTPRALPGNVEAEQKSQDAARQALLREYFQAAIRHHNLEKVLDVFGKDLQAIGADLGLLAYARALYDGASRAFSLGKRILGKKS